MPFIPVEQLPGADLGRVALCGPSGSGKSLTALKIARGLVGEKGRIALVDSENGSSRKYRAFEKYDVAILESYEPAKYVAEMVLAEKAKYSVLIIDGISQAWAGKGGMLEQHDKAAAKLGDSFRAWGNITPEQNRFVDAMLKLKCHLIVTLRVKTERVVEQVGGRTKIREVGLKPVQRDGVEYDFDMICDIEKDTHKLVVSKSRCPKLDGYEEVKAGEGFGRLIREWLDTGVGKSKVDMVRDQIRELAAAVGQGEDVEPLLEMAGDDLTALDEVQKGLIA